MKADGITSFSMFPLCCILSFVCVYLSCYTVSSSVFHAMTQNTAQDFLLDFLLRTSRSCIVFRNDCMRTMYICFKQGTITTQQQFGREINAQLLQSVATNLRKCMQLILCSYFTCSIGSIPCD